MSPEIYSQRVRIYGSGRILNFLIVTASCTRVKQSPLTTFGRVRARRLRHDLCMAASLDYRAHLQHISYPSFLSVLSAMSPKFAAAHFHILCYYRLPAPELTRSSSMFALAGSFYRDIETLLLLSRSPGAPQHHLHTKSSWLITLVGIHSSLEGISLTSNSFLVLCSCHSCRTHLVLELAAAGECALMRALNGFALFETHVMQGKTPSTKSKSKVMVRMSLECHCVVAVRLSSERVVDARALAISFPTATRPPAIDRAANIVTRLWPCF
jgi:hypothetical protein